jgi:ribulose-5-phosphate 4-epimerase/fuculose-1-phosphate aldolase
MLSGERYDGSAKNKKDAIVQCVLANRILANEKVMDAYGHVSVRNPENPETFFIARAISPEFVTEDDVLECTFDGTILTKNTTKKPYGERIIHASVFKVRPDVNAIAHSHPHSLIPFAASEIPFCSTFHSCSMFYDGLPVYKDLALDSALHISTVEEAERMAPTIGNGRGFLIRNHGVVVACDNVMQTVLASIFLRDAADILQKTLAMGATPIYLDPEEAKRCTDLMFGVVGLTRGWNYWITKAKAAFPDISHLEA